MSLRDEIEQMIQFRIAENPAVQRAYVEFGHDPGKAVGASPIEVFMLYNTKLEALTKAIYRLCDEVDALRP